MPTLNTTENNESEIYFNTRVITDNIPEVRVPLEGHITGKYLKLIELLTE